MKTIDEYVAEVKSGQRDGCTVLLSGDEASDAAGFYVSLASRNFGLDELTGEKAYKFFWPFIARIVPEQRNSLRIGLWKSPKGHVSCDVNLWVEDRRTAEAIGKLNNQEAIWDCANAQCISTGGTGEAVIQKPAQFARFVQLFYAGGMGVYRALDYLFGLAHRSGKI